MGAGFIDTPEAFRSLQKIGGGYNRATKGPRNLILRQLAEALSTGGIGARIPIIQRAVESSKMAGAEALKGTESTLAKYGVGGPFAAKQMANVGTQTRLATSRVPTDMTQQFIQSTVPYLAQTQNTGMQALSTGAQGELSTASFNALQFKALMQDIKNSIAGAFGNTSTGAAGGGQL